MQETLLKTRYFERGLPSSLWKVNFIFFIRTHSLLTYKIMKNKRGLELVFFMLQNKFKKVSFINVVLPDQVWWCNIKHFLSYSKITFADLCKSINELNYATHFKGCLFGEKIKNNGQKL